MYEVVEESFIGAALESWSSAIEWRLSTTSAPKAGQSVVRPELRSVSRPAYVGHAAGSSGSLVQADLLTSWLNW